MENLAKLKVTLPTGIGKDIVDTQIRLDDGRELYVREFQVRSNEKHHEMELVLVIPAFGFDYETQKEQE